MSVKDQREIELVRFELKYCERCGRTRLRALGDESIYCDRCLPEVEELPEPRRGRHPSAIRTNRRQYEFGQELEGAAVYGGGVA